MSAQTDEARQAAALDVTTPADREVRVERVFAAPRLRVWQAYTEPDQVGAVVGPGQPIDRRAPGGQARRPLAVRRARPRRRRKGSRAGFAR